MVKSLRAVPMTSIPGNNPANTSAGQANTAPRAGRVLPALSGHWERSAGARCNCLRVSLLGLGAVLVGFALLPYVGIVDDAIQVIVHALLAILGIVFLGGAYHVIRRDLLPPLTHMRTWARAIRDGELAARIPLTDRGGLKELTEDINIISDKLQGLSLDMEAQVRKQTDRIKHETRSLEILYDVAASISNSRDLDDLLTRFLHTLKEVVHARAATVRLLTHDKQMRLVASIGLSDGAIAHEQIMPSQHCLCGQVVADGVIRSGTGIHNCDHLAGAPLFPTDDIEVIAVPLQYRERTLGVYNLFVDRQQTGPDCDDILLISIGRHLGMAIEKANVDEEANRLTIIEERTRIAHELHDSLAQTLASLRFQVRVLDETLHQGDESALWAELERIENSLDEAYTELRGLIDHFRAPIDRRGLLPAIEKVVERFRNESDIQIFLQKEWGGPALPEDLEIQVLRIVQEALCNVRKHSRAHTVRVLMRGQDNGQFRVLIEDDGTGMEPPRASSTPGEHVGLSIMEERARRIGGRIHFESEPGEGTRVQLTFRAPARSAPHNVSEVSVPLPATDKTPR